MTISTFTSSIVQKRERKHATLIQENQTIFWGMTLKNWMWWKQTSHFLITERLVPCLRFNHIRPKGHQIGHHRNLAMFIQERGKVDQPPLECYHWMWIMWIYIEHKIWSPLSHFYLVEIYGRGEVFTNKEVYKSTIRTHTHAGYHQEWVAMSKTDLHTWKPIVAEHLSVQITTVPRLSRKHDLQTEGWPFVSPVCHWERHVGTDLQTGPCSGLSSFPFQMLARRKNTCHVSHIQISPMN